jgi:L-threonylcarbamoyladenylate synthase
LSRATRKRQWKQRQAEKLPVCATLTDVATDLIEIHPLDPSPEALDRAAEAVRRGRVIAIPTDALYALVGDPFSLLAVRQVYHAKGREIHRTLPILVRDTLMVEELAREISPRFNVLARKFWPGPLTIILPASAKMPLRATGNTGRLAVRQARCEVADQLISRLNQPIIATSANISGRPTCRSGIEVFGIMDGSIELVLDGGACEGMGATTVDITEPEWRVIKEGAISEKEIAECLEAVDE